MGATRRRHTTATVRFSFVGLAFTALILGYIGFDQYFTQGRLPGGTMLNLLYFDLQLFVLGADPLQEAIDIPVTLQIARFAAPAVTMFALAEAARLLLATEVSKIRARNARGHVIVCGDTPAASALARNLAYAGKRTVVVRNRPIGALELGRGRMLGVSGDATNPDVLRGAGGRRATVLYACSEESATNVAIAAAAGKVMADGGARATVYAQIHDPDRAVALQARRLGVAASPGLRLDFFNLDQLAVQVLLSERPPTGSDGQAPRLLVAGDAPFVRALIVAVARDWRVRRESESERVLIDLVGPGAGDLLGSLNERYVIVDEACAIKAWEWDVPRLLRSQPDARYDDAYLCYRDEEFGLELALSAYDLWHQVKGHVVVPVDGLAGMTDAFGADQGRALLDEVHGKIRLFPKNAVACDPGLIAEDLVERLARLIHERYLVACRARPADPTDPASLVDWARLDEARRGSNRAQASSIGAKLHAIGCTIVARSGHGDFGLTAEETELLAEAEQRRWVREHAERGWKYGPVRDTARRLSPYLRQWSELSDDDREKNRAAVKELPAILADAGFQIVRIGGEGSEP
jgi:voltage-gated potassium channel Kch